MVEIEAVEGPLDERKLDWVARLYGTIDPKYAERGFLEHLFVLGPAGPALHAFASAAGEPVGHAAVVPTPARRGSAPLRAGKLEALFVSESHRGRSSAGTPVVRRLLDALYALSDAQRIELLHAYVLPPVGRVIGFARLDDVGAPSLVALLRPRSGARPNPAELALSVVQTAAREGAGAVVRAVRPRAGPAIVRRALPHDTDLLETPSIPEGAWAVVSNGAFEWYASSPSVRVLEIPGAAGSRALVQLPASRDEPLRVAAWRSQRPGPASAVAFLHAAGRLARSTGAVTLRLQQPEHDPSLRRAARALGFVPRRDLTTLWVRTRDPALARTEAVVPTPMLYLGF